MRSREDLSESCATVRDLIYSSAQGEELSPEEARSLESHIDECADCMAERKRVRNFTTNISDLLHSLKPDENLRRKVLRKIEVGAEKKQAWKPIAALAGAIVFALVVLLLGREQPSAAIRAYSGTPKIHRAVAGKFQSIPFTSELINGDRIELAEGESVCVIVDGCSVELTGPSRAQLDTSSSSVFEIHLLAESNLIAESNDTALIIHMGDVSVRASHASVEVTVDASGGSRIAARNAYVSVHSPRGNSIVRKNSAIHIDQNGLPVEPN